MKLCCEDCIPCCDYCRHAFQGTANVNGETITTGPLGCTLHSEESYQVTARSCGFCEDFHCTNVYDEPKWLYRLESGTPDKGLWYREDGEWVWTIGELADCETKNLPMDFDPRYRKDGRHWFSSCSNKEDLAHWYSLADALALIDQGFVFTRYLATEYVEYENETTFIKETCKAREVIDISEIWEVV